MDKVGGRIMGIDYGSVRIGVAMSDETNTIAFGKEALLNDNVCFKKIADLVRKNDIVRIVLGYPLNLKGIKSEQTLDVERFEVKLKDYLDKNLPGKTVEIILWDERFTSKMAQESLLQSGMKKKKRQQKSNLDIISSALLLQSYIDSMK
jgi:putative Holliday junction resolvase